MGIRESQPMGLPDEAHEFLSKNALLINPCPHCFRDGGYWTEDVVDGTYGMF